MTRKSFTASGTFVVPAGITRVRVYGIRQPGKFFCGASVGMQIDDEGELWTWGNAGSGALGDGTIANKSSPVKVQGSLRWLFVSSGGTASSNHCAGITSNGLTYTWGSNNSGSLGNNTNTAAFSSPVQVVGAIKFKKVFVGSEDHMVGLTSEGAAWCWGANSQGELGANNTTSRSSPVAVVGSVVFKDIAADYRANAGLSSIGEVYVWGRNNEGQLGQGNNGAGTEKSSPVKVSGLSSGFQKIIAAGLTFVALDANGRCWGWGSNTNGEIGDSTSGFGNDKASPVSTVQGSLVFTELYGCNDSGTGGATLLAKASNGNYYAWGSNSLGQFGVGNTSARSSPVQVLSGLDFLWLNGYNQGFQGIKKDGTVWAWGANANGQLGDGTVVPKSTPIQLTTHPIYRTRATVVDHLVTVVPGASVSLVVNDGTIAYFGSTPVMPMADALVVEW